MFWWWGLLCFGVLGVFFCFGGLGIDIKPFFFSVFTYSTLGILSFASAFCFLL